MILIFTVNSSLGTFSKKNTTYFLVVVRLPFTMRVEVETDLMLPSPPPMLPIVSSEEKEVNSAGEERKNEVENKTTQIPHYNYSSHAQKEPKRSKLKYNKGKIMMT